MSNPNTNRDVWERFVANNNIKKNLKVFVKKTFQNTREGPTVNNKLVDPYLPGKENKDKLENYFSENKTGSSKKEKNR